jgi:hypothetical protein
MRGDLALGRTAHALVTAASIDNVRLHADLTLWLCHGRA